MTLPKLLQQMRARLAAATPGKWEQARYKDSAEYAVHVPALGETHEGGLHGITICRGMDGPNRVNNSQFVAHAPTDLAFALDALEIALGVIDVADLCQFEGCKACAARESFISKARAKIDALAKARGE